MTLRGAGVFQIELFYSEYILQIYRIEYSVHFVFQCVKLIDMSRQVKVAHTPVLRVLHSVVYIGTLNNVFVKPKS
jgi:hypothetical protein